MSNALPELKRRLADANALSSAIGLMGWDQQTLMPKGGAQARAEHLGILSRMVHEMTTSPEVGELLDKAAPDSEEDRALLRIVRREYDKRTKIPAALVEEESKLRSEAHEAWVTARKENDFQSFLPILGRMFEIAGEKAVHLGYKASPYDALLDLYEEGSTAADCRSMFDSIREPQAAIIRETQQQPKIDDSFLTGSWDDQAQAAFTEKLVRAIGFDFTRGRQDTAPHPFCTGWSIGDIRITTRFQDYLPSAIFGSLHEAGHGMYEQGSPMEWDRTPLAGGVSLGVHESQSRLWENIVGRSKAFWGRFLPDLKESFPALGDVDLDTFYRTVNKVEPTFIRVEADELTYNMHVMVRFEIEVEVLEGRLAVKDIPEVWNAKYEHYLGIRPANHGEGCLQDVHWSMGLIGYFPTYTIGNLLSYQIWRALERDLGNGDELIAKGEFAKILEWLQTKVYRLGSSMTPKEVVLHATGKPLSADDYLSGLDAKYRSIYGL